MQIQPLVKAVGTSFRPLSGYYMMARQLCNRLDFLSLTLRKKGGSGREVRSASRRKKGQQNPWQQTKIETIPDGGPLNSCWLVKYFLRGRQPERNRDKRPQGELEKRWDWQDRQDNSRQWTFLHTQFVGKQNEHFFAGLFNTSWHSTRLPYSFKQASIHSIFALAPKGLVCLWSKTEKKKTLD